MVTEGPVIARARLLVVRILVGKIPFFTVSLRVLEALLDHLWLHIYKHRVGSKFTTFKISLEVCLNDSLLHDL